METLPRETVVDVLENRLREEILGGRHPAGSLLPPERELASGYGVTRTTLKHAFGRLVQAGLLETRHGVGTRVRDFARLGGADLLPMFVRHSPDWLAEVFQARRDIGALIAARAAREASGEQRQELLALLEAVGAADGDDRVQLADAEVHRALARATGNRVYVLLTNTLFNAYLPVRSGLVGPFQDAVRARARLAPVVEAVVEGDEQAARTAAGKYLTETEEIMWERLGKTSGQARRSQRDRRSPKARTAHRGKARTTAQPRAERGARSETASREAEQRLATRSNR